MTDTEKYSPKIRHVHLYIDNNVMCEETEKAIAALKNLYDVTGLRDLRLIDTEQSWREKHEYYNLINAVPGEKLPEIKQYHDVVETKACRKIFNDLSGKVLKQFVEPIVTQVDIVDKDYHMRTGSSKESTSKSLEILLRHQDLYTLKSPLMRHAKWLAKPLQ